MFPGFANLEFGPFVSGFHRAAVDADFKQKLSAFLEEVVLPQVAEPFASVQGRLTARYDEDRYCAETSAVRNIYSLKLAFCRANGDDTLEVELKFDPVTGRFRPRRANQEVCVVTAWHRARAEEIGEICERVAAGEEVSSTCPQCGADLSITVSPSLRAAACERGCFDFDRHLDVASGEMIHGHTFFRARSRRR